MVGDTNSRGRIDTADRWGRSDFCIAQTTTPVLHPQSVTGSSRVRVFFHDELKVLGRFCLALLGQNLPSTPDPHSV